MDDRAKSCLIALRRILRAAEENTRATARATGLSVPQLIVLQIVADAGEATPKTIARTAGIAPATATALIDKLVRYELVRRRRSDRDRRQYWLALTERGRGLLDSAPDALHSRFAEKLATLPDWEQAMLMASLERVAGLIAAGTPQTASPLLHVGQDFHASGGPEGGPRTGEPQEAAPDLPAPPTPHRG